MTTKRNVLMIGDTEFAKWHPMTGFDREFRAILADFEFTQTTDYNQFMEANLRRYDLCICFADRWTALTDEQTVGLASFVLHGGGLLLVHNGISIQARRELMMLAGGKFTGHPEQRMLNYRVKSADHPIIAGIGGFSAMEEPYQFVMDQLAETTILLEYDLDGKACPAAWAHVYGSGRVVYLSPGHNLATLLDPTYRIIIRNAANWALAGSSR